MLAISMLFCISISIYYIHTEVYMIHKKKLAFERIYFEILKVQRVVLYGTHSRSLETELRTPFSVLGCG